jgi:protein MpaA
MNFSELRAGTSVEGDEIKAYKSETTGDKYLYLMAGVHGDEVEGVYVVDQLFKWLKEQDFNIPMVVIPILNVDGYRAGTRVNAHGVDLNRNLNTDCWESEARAAKYNPGSAPLSEPENQFLVKLFEKFHPGFIMTIHSWKPIVNYNGDCEDIAKFMAEENGYEIADDIGYPTPGSLGTYGSVNLNCPVLTFECPTLSDDVTLKSVWEENEVAFKNIFDKAQYERFLK